MASETNYTALPPTDTTPSSDSPPPKVEPILPQILGSPEPWPCVLFDVIAPTKLNPIFLEDLIHLVRHDKVKLYPSFSAMCGARALVTGNIVVFLKPEKHLTIHNANAAGRLVLHLAAIEYSQAGEKGAPVAVASKAVDGPGWTLLEYKDWREMSRKKGKDEL
ncbi:uncharacterized protein ACLA_013110 [Aspergillus clavatus NRRL 1]|uniref:Uncharacterized protein n=1 Tax=Aspergillus clavatus (strain ATCC 1007 / CBS 513.65 / DSM 816 / NCTC 3887 / NRRL 1 / QM 1276 / 107) TaxID=344612 RepID=A1CAV9_ASPCL|nr:uncharacterized protein ACLA_013110 [Aspergillus clavatus NRRL 1]EAW12877.1 conserved hypothetical protein [Aspergillus clavatus NRRL 1]